MVRKTLATTTSTYTVRKGKHSTVDLLFSFVWDTPCREQHVLERGLLGTHAGSKGLRSALVWYCGIPPLLLLLLLPILLVFFWLWSGTLKFPDAGWDTVLD